MSPREFVSSKRMHLLQTYVLFVQICYHVKKLTLELATVGR